MSAPAEVRSLAVYDRIADPMAAVRSFGEIIAKSQMFSCENVEQGQVLAMECLASRMPPLSLKKRYHLIKGSLSDRADWMLGEFRRRGGKHRIVERTPEAAIVEMTFDGDVQRFAFTWEAAQQEATPYQGKEKDVVASLLTGRKPPLKVKYATPHSRMQMLWARVVSDGVRAMCPEAVTGIYTPEEIHDFTGNGQAVAEVDTKLTKVTNGAYVPEEIGDGDDIAGGAGSIVVEAEVVPDTATAEATETKSEAGNFYATSQQVRQILELYSLLQVPVEAQEAALKKRGCNALWSLTEAQAAEIIEKLDSLVAKVTADQSLADPLAKSLPTDGPATQPQIDQVKQLIAEVAQNGQPDIAKRVKAKLESHGLAKLADLSMAEIGRLHAALSVRNLEAFFTSNLEGYGKQPKN